MRASPQIIVLFSGGLDSLLTARLLERQGLRVRCLHAHSPFFGGEAQAEHWRAVHGLDIDTLDVGEAFAAMLRERPAHGFGKVLNPCVDCKILLLREARRYMEAVGARALATGEVLGQRPMSQRRDTLHLIPREAGVTDVLVRPLCAKLLPPTPVEEQGLVDREGLLDIWGRGRTRQLALAREFGLAEIPTPGGGCRLTERENARRYWMALSRLPHPSAGDFDLCNVGRQFWHGEGERSYWLCVGRHSADNARLLACAGGSDATLRLRDMPGPVALARDGATWPAEVLRQAASLTASYAPRAMACGCEAAVRIRLGGETRELCVTPARLVGWGEPAWDEIRAFLKAEARARLVRDAVKGGGGEG